MRTIISIIILVCIKIFMNISRTFISVSYTHLLYPYQMYIHWSPSDQGNILFNDKRFVSLLYRWHNDEFTEYNKVSDAGSYIKDSIYDFIDDSQKVVIVVDCENSDPYKLSATLRRLNSTYTEKITSIILFDDIHTASAWSSLEKFTSVSVEHILIERIKQKDVYKRQAAGHHRVCIRILSISILLLDIIGIVWTHQTHEFLHGVDHPGTL